MGTYAFRVPTLQLPQLLPSPDLTLPKEGSEHMVPTRVPAHTLVQSQIHAQVLLHAHPHRLHIRACVHTCACTYPHVYTQANTFLQSLQASHPHDLSALGVGCAPGGSCHLPVTHTGFLALLKLPHHHTDTTGTTSCQRRRVTAVWMHLLAQQEGDLWESFPRSQFLQ